MTFCRSRGWLLLPLLLVLLVAGTAGAAAALPAGDDLARRVHDRYLGDDSTAAVTMILVDRRGRRRQRQLEVKTRMAAGLRRTLIRFLSPADIAGTAFLSLERKDGDTTQFLYLPALKRSRRIVASSKGRRFVNSDFTYEDMERRPVADYENRCVGEEKLPMGDCWILECRPRPRRKSRYSRLRFWVRKDNAVPLRVFYFDRRGKHVKTYEVLKLALVQQIWTEMEVKMSDLVEKHATIFATKTISYNHNLPDSLFTVRSLEK